MSSYLDKLAVYSDKCRDGQDFINLRLNYINISEISFPSEFNYPNTSSAVNSNWIIDVDPALAANIQEKRTFCTKGKAIVNFTGTTCIIRVGISFGWGDADVYIDGVRPSTIPNVISPLDVVSSNETVNVNTGYYDYVLADNLLPGQHTLILYINNSATTPFVFSCVKCADNTNSSLVLNLSSPLYINPYSDLNGNGSSQLAVDHAKHLFNLCKFHNSINLKIQNPTSNTIYNTNIALTSNPFIDYLNFGFDTISGEVVNAQTYPINTLTFPATNTLLHNGVLTTSISVVPQFITTFSNQLINLQLSAEYPDPNGSIVQTNYSSVPLDSSLITYTGAWSSDNDFSEQRYYADTSSAKFSFSAKGKLIVRVQKDWGWGNFIVYKNGVLFSNSSSLTCSTTTDPSPYFEDIIVGDLGSSLCTVQIRNAANNTIVFTGVRYEYPSTFTNVTENITINVNLARIPNYTPCEYSKTLPYVAGGKVSIGKVDMSSKATDLTIPIVGSYEQALKTSIDIYARFPSYNICYIEGFDKELSTYDLVVTDPYATSNSKVDALHEAGCKVILYTSFGEEDAVNTKLYDFVSTSVEPWSVSTAGPDVGNTGPGGYASYYCKANDNFAEISECTHDNSRIGLKTCSLNRSEYFSGLGRCSKVCTHDTVKGYVAYSTGGNCGGGYNSTDYWKRDAMAACSNASCPKYAPNNHKCPAYESGAGWGQDFSVVTVNFPDQNGIWGSSYINAGNTNWHNRILKYYLPIIFGPRQEPVTFTAALLSVDSGGGADSGLGFRVPYINEDPSTNYPDGRQGYFPIDPDAPMEINFNGTVLVSNIDYSYNTKLGTFVVQSESSGLTLKVGDVLTVTLTYFSPNADGIFMDTIDSVDVFPSKNYQNGMVSLIGKVRKSWPTKEICSNRGFTILDNAIKYINYVMAESIRSEYNWDTGQYYIITDPNTVAYNQGLIAQLKRLRQNHVFDVLSLNYAADDSSGDVIREANTLADYQDGFLSATANILLNNVLPFRPIRLTNLRINTNLFTKVGEYV
jgi:hypothetical protein